MRLVCLFVFTCCIVTVLGPNMLQVANPLAAKHEKPSSWWRWWPNMKKKVKATSELNPVESTLDKLLSTLVGLSTLMSTVVFIGTAIMVTVRMVRRWMRSEQDTAIESGVINKLLMAELQANQSKLSRLSPTVPLGTSQTESTFHRLTNFLAHNYYTLMVLFVFLYIGLMIVFFHLSKSPSTQAITPQNRYSRRKRKRKGKIQI